ncbi:MAG TPA: M43 family zinc metalloprotease, partial [Flavobacteriales bacterium]|nr:M43 family zinc metalloprotease [Flavobacteriales bacterium]
MLRLFLAMALTAALAPLNILRAQGCGTRPPTPSQYAYARDVVSQIDVQQLRNAGTTCIPLQAHIVRRTNGTGGLSMQDLNIGLSYLNHYYLPAGIEFFWKGSPDVANNDDYFDFDQTAPDSDVENTLVGLFTTATNAVNVYFVDSVTTSTGFVAGGYAYFPANVASSNRMVIRNDQLVGWPTGVFIHEMGHYLNLFHTFEGTSAGPASANAENVPRSGVQANCSSRGDLLCGTHADPGANNNLLSGCIYTGTAMDINGITYTPPVENPMSYWDADCGDTFTGDQYTRIMQGLITRLGHNTYSLNAAAQSVLAASGLTATLNVNVVQLNWADNAANDLGYLIERSTTSASSGFVQLNRGATAASATGFTDTDVQSNTTYWYRVKATNGDCNTYS